MNKGINAIIAIIMLITSIPEFSSIFHTQVSIEKELSGILMILFLFYMSFLFDKKE